MGLVTWNALSILILQCFTLTGYGFFSSFLEIVFRMKTKYLLRAGKTKKGDQVDYVASFPAVHFDGPRFISHLRPEPYMWIGFPVGSFPTKPKQMKLSEYLFLFTFHPGICANCANGCKLYFCVNCANGCVYLYFPNQPKWGFTCDV